MSEQRKSRAGRMSKIQKEFFVSFLEGHKYLIETKIDPFQLEKWNTTWKELAGELNRLQGAKKTVTQWKETFNEFKANTRKKARLIHIQHHNIGGGPKTEKDLTPLEERLLALLSKISITGVPGIPEGGVVEDVHKNDNLANSESLEDIVIEETITDDLNWIEETTPVLRVLQLSESNPSTSAIPDPDIIFQVQDPTKQGKYNLTKERSRTRKTKNEATATKATFETVAKNHEKCLRVLSESNRELASALNRLSTIKNKKRFKSSVFNLHF